MPQSHEPTTSSFFSQLDVSPGTAPRRRGDEIETMLRDIRDAQDRQNELLEELIHLLATTHRQRTNELDRWRKAHPQLASDCRETVNILGKVQAEYLHRLTAEVRESADELADGEFLTNELIDRFGPRLAHLHSLLQVLSHLSGNGSND